MLLRVAALTDVGRTRDHNEDAWFFEQAPDGAWILVVCDGMGGHEAGEVASAAATKRLQTFLHVADRSDPARLVYDALVAANQAVIDEAAATGNPTMGTTAVVAMIVGNKAWYGWVGDSRAYQLRAGAILDRSVDHTRVQALVDAGVLTAEEARHHPESNVLVQALGGGAGAQANFHPTVYAEPLEMQPGDLILMCSDGLHDLIDDEELYGVIAGHDPTGACKALVDQANERGGYDNITTLIALYDAERIPPARGTSPPHKPRPAVEPPEEPLPDPSTFRPSYTWLIVLLLLLALTCGVGGAMAIVAPTPAPPPAAAKPAP